MGGVGGANGVGGAGVSRTAAALCLVFNAFVWGVSWWPFRRLADAGLHPLWATALVYAVVVAVLTLRRPGAWREVLRHPALLAILLAAGTTNASFNWAVTIGDVVRVVLLFYLMPLWAVVLARLVLHEAITAGAVLRALLALAGGAIVLTSAPDAVAGDGGPARASLLADALGVLGGFTFALNNVLLRREREHSSDARALAMFAGGMVVAGALAWGLQQAGQVPRPPVPEPAWGVHLLLLVTMFGAGNLALQTGAAHLPANTAALLMMTEVLFASVSALALGAGRFTASLAVGATLIVGTAIVGVLASRGD